MDGIIWTVPSRLTPPGREAIIHRQSPGQYIRLHRRRRRPKRRKKCHRPIPRRRQNRPAVEIQNRLPLIRPRRRKRGPRQRRSSAHGKCHRPSDGVVIHIDRPAPR